MKRFLLLGLALFLSGYGWSEIRHYRWVPEDAPRWNPFALKESGLGRTLARVLTEQANTAYHHGLFEQKEQTTANPLAHWLDEGNTALGFQGRLKDRPVERFPLRPYEVRQALEQTEAKLRLAFELDPGNYTAYDVYLFFLTTQVTRTEFASTSGTQLEDDDEQGKGAPHPENKVDVFQQWAGQERQRRHTRALEITDEAIRKFRTNTEDPERYLTGASIWYNRFMLLAPDVAQRQESAGARQKFDEVGQPTLEKMEAYLQSARTCRTKLEQTGLWQAIPERRQEFMEVTLLLEKSADALAVALRTNRSQMVRDRSGLTVREPSTRYQASNVGPLPPQSQ